MPFSITFKMSERRACQIMTQPRSTQRFKGKKRVNDAPLIRAMREVAMRLPRAGYRTVTKHLRRDGWVVNSKRIRNYSGPLSEGLSKRLG